MLRAIIDFVCMLIDGTFIVDTVASGEEMIDEW
jgi:hypothetical protein